MSFEIDVKKLCELSKLEIPDAMIQETSNKVREVLDLFNKLDEFDISEIHTSSDNDQLRLEKPINTMRDDIPRTIIPDSRPSETMVKFHSTKNGFVLGPRI